MESPEKYVGLVSQHSDYHEKLLELGEAFTGRLSSKDAGLFAWVQAEKPVLGLCYMNAQKYVLLHPGTDLTYYEGFWSWSATGVPLHHAWLVDAEGRVVDLTAEDGDRGVEDADPSKDEYFGMAVPTWFVREQAIETKQWGIVSHAYLQHLAEEKGAA